MEPTRGNDARDEDEAAIRARIDAFVARHFSVAGTLALHRNALGLDLLRAPVNVFLSPVFLVTRLLALILGLIRLRGAARWLGGRRVFLQTATARAVGAALRAELLDGPPSRRTDRLIDDYTGVRGAVAELCTTALVVLLGVVLFRTATPGVISLAPYVTDHAARSVAVADFPLGQRLGGVWYGLFPVELPVWWVATVGAALAMAASIVTTFAGLLADPVQAWLGIHHRRLARLVARVGAGDAPPAAPAREHLLARAADIGDAAVSLIRMFRS